jgi:C4-dicarboxylate transporter DctM subunit
MVLCFALTVSVAVSIGLAAVLGIQASNANMLISVKEMFNAINKFPLAAIPFFILAGNLMETGGISRRLVEFAKSIVGGVQGGLPMTCVLTCMIFAAVSGSSVATTFAIGAILIPALIKHGYPTSYAAALQATSAELGVIIPPSIPMILYGVSAEVSIGELFIAGFGPGLLIGGALMLFVWALVQVEGLGQERRRRPPAFRPASAGRLGAADAGDHPGRHLRRHLHADRGVGGGGVLRAGGRHRHLPRDQPADLYAILRKSVISSAVIMFIIANAGLFAFLITRAGVPDAIGRWLQSC